MASSNIKTSVFSPVKGKELTMVNYERCEQKNQASITQIYLTS